MDHPARRMSEEWRSQMAVLREALASLESSKVRVRSDGMDRLSNIITDRERCKFLDENHSLRGTAPEDAADAVKWVDVFRAVETSFGKVFETKDGADANNTKQKQMIDLLQKVIFAANRNSNQPHLDKHMLFRTVKFIIVPSIFEAFSHQVIEIVNHYLSIPTYVACTNGNDWTEFLSKVIKLLVSQLKKERAPPQFLYEITIKGIVHGSNYPGVISLLRTRVVDFFKFSIASKNKGIFIERCLLIMEAYIQLCRLNAVEARGILCAAGVVLIAHVLSTNCIETSEQQDKACELFLLQLKLHAPFDLDSGSSFYTENQTSWEEVIEKLFAFCKEAIETVAAKRREKSKNQKNIQIPDKLLQLAVKCTKFYNINKVKTPVMMEDETFEPPSKKARVLKPFDQIVESTVIMSHGADQLTWLTYIGAVLLQYPHMMEKASVFKKLLNIGRSLLTSDYIEFQEIFTFLRSLLYCERYLLEAGLLTEKSDIWDQIWDILVKSFAVREATGASLLLLRDILLYCQPKNIGIFLSLFANSSLTLSLPSLDLVREYLICCYLPSTLPSGLLPTGGMKSSARLLVIKWLIPSIKKDIDPEVERLVPTLVYGLLVKKTNYVILTECHQSSPCLDIPPREEFEKLILRSSFVPEPEDPVTDKLVGERRMQLNLIKGADEFLDSDGIVIPLLEYLQADILEFPEIATNKSGAVKLIHHLIFRSKLFLNLLDLLLKYPVQDSSDFRPTLEALLDSALDRCGSILSKYLRTETKINRIYPVLCLINSLLQSHHLCDEAKELLGAKFPRTLVETIVAVLQKNSDEDPTDDSKGDEFHVTVGGPDSLGDDVQDDGVSKFQIKQLIATEALKCICEFTQVYDGRSELLYSVVEIILSNAGLSASHSFFGLCYTFISRAHPVFVRCDHKLVSKVLELVQLLCQRFHHNAICTTSLWKIFKDLIPAIRHFEESHKFMILVGNMTRFINHQGIQSCLSYLDLMVKLSEWDPGLTWTHFVPRKFNESTPQKKYPLLELQTFLSTQPSCHQIRLAAVQAICSVFRNYGKPLNLNASPQHSNGMEVDQVVPTMSENDLMSPWFLSVKQALYEMYNASAKLSSCEKREEGVNCVAAAVYGCTQIAFSNEFMEQPGLYLLMEVVSSKNVRQELAIQALERASPHAMKAMKLYAPYNLDLWIQNGLEPDKVPFRLFGCSSLQSFYTIYGKYMIVRLFERYRLDILDELALQMKMNRSALIKVCFNEIYGRLLCKSIIEGKASDRDAANAVDILKKSVDGEASFEQIVTEKLHELAMELTSCLFDRNVCLEWSCSDVVLPQAVPYPLTEDQLKLAWSWLRSQAKGVDGHIAYHLAKTSHSSIYSMLLTLANRIHEAHNHLIRLWRLHHLSFFVNILTEVSVGSFGFVKSYLCHFVIHAYLRFLVLNDENDSGSAFFQSVLFHLRSYINRLMDLDYEEMQHYYKLVIHKLVSMTSSHPKLQDAIFATLNVLLVDNHEKFGETIRTLDPLPEMDIFRDLRCSRIITHYDDYIGGLPAKLKLAVANVKNSGYVCTKETLQYIRKLMEENKEEFATLVQELEGKRFKDECANDPIHNLIHLLVSVINKGEDTELLREACKCLGEIGPIDLSLLVLPVYGQQYKIVSDISAPQAVLELATNCLEDSDIQIVSTAAGVLKKLLETDDCSLCIMTSDSDPKLRNILKPFRCMRKMRPSYVQLSSTAVTTLMDKLPIDESWTFSEWLMSFTCTLIDCTVSKDSIVSCLKPLCLLKTEFCEEVLPYVLLTFLKVGISSPAIRKTMTDYFCNFFARFVDLTSTQENIQGSKRRYSLYTNKSALRCLLRCVQFLRQHPTPPDFKRPNVPITTKWDSNFWLDFNYLHIAKAAQFCGAYLTSIMFGEIYALEAENTQNSEVPVASTSRMKLPAAAAIPSDTRTEIEKLLLKAFTNIGEPDGVYGCGSARFLDFSSQIQHLQSTQSWDQVLSAEDFHGVRNEKGICVSLKNKGLYNTLQTQLLGIEARSGYLDEHLRDIQHECAWRLSNWDMNMDKVSYIRDTVEFNTAASGSGQQFIYESMQSAIRKNCQKLDQALKRSYEVILADLRHANLESSENLYGFLSQLQMVRLVEDMNKLSDNNLDVIDSKWRIQHSMPCPDFKYLEPVLSVKKVMLNSLYQKTQNNVFQAACDDTLFSLVEQARDAGRVELAEKYTLEISDSVNFSKKKSVQKAKNYKLRGNDDIARQILENLLSSNTPETTSLYPTILLLQGEWLFQSVAELNSVICKDYLQQACDILSRSNQSSSEEIAKAHIALAEFADTQVQKIREHIQGELFREKASLLQQSEKDLKRLQPQPTSDKEARTTHMLLTKQYRMDKEEIQHTYAQKDVFQHMALDNYLKGLGLINKYDLFIFRVIALWLDASGGNQRVEIGNAPSKLDEAMKSKDIPSYKYIPVLHQLSGRLGNNTTSTASLLDSILIKCAKEHPYQTLPVLLSQALLHKDKELTGKTLSRVSDSSENRVKAARALIEKLKREKKGSELSTLVAKMEFSWNALISFAYYKPSLKAAEQRISIPSSSDLLRIDDIPVPTLHINTSPSGVYKDVVFVKKFENFFFLVGGVNVPKRIICIAKNGKSYPMLAKGNDDLRQDAVMQQVFGVMNQLFAQEPKTKKKGLHVRTYKVVPLSQRSGVLEWCENTQTLGDYLVGGNPPKGGAHAQYRPNDYTASQCRQKMQDKKTYGNNAMKLEVFNDILAHFKPVFHHFFFENFQDAGSFFERRLAYTRSVAASSIVGYILGLGDRHVQNILIDRTTAEVIHIDFGVAFDQGKLLPTPETIPFRLTRDMVDGFGFCGIEGVFRRSCESTMEVLRKNADIIITILEVLLYDPLYLWTLSEERKHKIQSEDRSQALNSRFVTDSAAETESKNAERNNTAARELRRLRCKLAGIQEGRASGYTMTVPGHVSQLISFAIDVNSLSKLYPGWQPYL